MKIAKRISGGLAIVAALVAANAWIVQRQTGQTLRNNPAPGRMIDVGGRRLHLFCRGTGSPTVVFEASGFGNYAIYGRAFDDTATITQACAYDRAGMGYSDPSPDPLDARHLVGDLERLLRAAEVPGPYVLVGMSAGGLVVRLFTSAHPSDVRGVVLVDALHEDFVPAMPKSRANAERLLTMAPLLARLGLLRWIDPFSLGKLPPEKHDLALALNYRAAPWEAAASLVKHLEESADQARRAAPPPSDLPLVVLTHGVPGDVLGPATDADEARSQEPKWQALQEAFAHTSRAGRYLCVEGAGHIVSASRPEVISKAIREVIERSSSP